MRSTARFPFRSMASDTIAAYAEKIRRSSLRQLRYRLCQRFIEAQGFDIAVELAQGIKTFAGACTRIANQIVEAILTGYDDEVSDATAQTYSDDYRIAPRKIAIDQVI